MLIIIYWRKDKKMEIKSFVLGETQIDYLIDEDKNVGMQIFPKSEAEKRTKPWEIKNEPYDPRAKYRHMWDMGKLAYFHLSSQNSDFPGYTMKSDDKLTLVSQEITENNETTTIKTILKNGDNCKIIHSLTYVSGHYGFEIETEFVNETGSDVTLEMLSSFALDNLSPFQTDDAPNSYNLHRFYGGWSMEGKHVCQSIEELSLEKTAL